MSGSFYREKIIKCLRFRETFNNRNKIIPMITLSAGRNIKIILRYNVTKARSADFGREIVYRSFFHDIIVSVDFPIVIV